MISWQLDQTLEMPFVLAAVQQALGQAQPLIWNSDQGSHFTSPQYTQLLSDAGVQISMDGRGRALDNIFTKRPWRTIKYEEVYLKEYDSRRRPTLAGRLSGLLQYRRLHQALDYETPAALYYGRGPIRVTATPVLPRPAGGKAGLWTSGNPQKRVRFTT